MTKTDRAEYLKQQQLQEAENKKLLEAYNAYYKKSPFCIKIQSLGTNISERYNIDFNIRFSTSTLIPEHCINFPYSYLKLIRENEQMASCVSEGLIKTYPANSAIKFYQLTCKRKLPQSLYDAKMIVGGKEKNIVKTYSYVEYDNKTKIAGLLALYLPIKENDDINKSAQYVSDWLHTFGYDLSEYNIIDSVEAYDADGNKINIMKLTYEARFYNKEIDLGKWLFHITDIKNAKKILTKGLIPKTNNALFLYQDRVYLFTDANIQELLMHANYKKDGTYVIFRLSTEKLENCSLFKIGKLLFYFDPKYSIDKNKSIAIYTHNTIPPNLIDDTCVVIEVKNNKIINSNTVNIHTLV